MYTMLLVPGRKADTLNLSPPLSAYLSSAHTPQLAQQMKDPLAGLDQLRVLVGVPKNTFTDDILEDMQKYVMLLDSLEMRFPIGDNEPVRLTFSWQEAFTDKTYKSTSLQFERLSALFNLGAGYSTMACAMNRELEDGNKRACHNFQCAAGCFHAMREVLERSPTECVGVDLSVDMASALTALNLAQAQECFYEKAVRSKMSAAVLAKLAAQACEYYTSAHTQFSSSSLGKSIPEYWAPESNTKARLFEGLAHFHHAADASARAEYGVQVAHLRAASALLEPLLKKRRGMSDVLCALVALHQGTVSRALAAAESDNGKIYNEFVPKEVARIERKSLVKAIPPPTFASHAGTADPLKPVIPFKLREAAMRYEERKDRVVKAEIACIDDQNEIAKTILCSLNLPGALQALDNSAAIPKEIMTRLREIQKKGGVGRLEEMMRTVMSLAEESVNLISEAERVLNEEEADDLTMRRHYGSRWTRTPSATLALPLRAELQRAKGDVEDGQQSNAHVVGRLAEDRDRLARLSAVDELVRDVPPAHSATLHTAQPTQNLRKLLGALNEVISRRLKMKEDLRTLSEKDDAVPALLSAPSQPTAAVLDQCLKKYEGLQDAIRGNFAEQDAIMEQIRITNIEFAGLKGRDDNTRRREQALQRIDSLIQTYETLEGNMREGIRFYTNFQDSLIKLKRRCEDLSFARRTEKEDILHALGSASFQDQQPSASPPSWTTMPSNAAAAHSTSNAPPPPYGMQAASAPPLPYADDASLPPYHQYGVQAGSAPPPPYGMQAGSAPPPPYGVQAGSAPPPPYSVQAGSAPSPQYGAQAGSTPPNPAIYGVHQGPPGAAHIQYVAALPPPFAQPPPMYYAAMPGGEPADPPPPYFLPPH